MITKEMTNEDRKLAITYLKEMQETYIEGNGYEIHPLPEYYAIETALEALEQESVLDKIRSEITNCLKALDDIEKSGLNIYFPNEMLGRRLTYQQCLKFIDKYKMETE